MTRRKADAEGAAPDANEAAEAAIPDADEAAEVATPDTYEAAEVATARADAADATPDAEAAPPRRRRRPRRQPAPKPLVIDRVQVADDALATVIGLAAHEVPGVVGMAPANLSEGLRRILGVSQVDEGVEVERGEQGATARVALHVVVAYGVNIPAVAESIVERVRYASKTYAGVEVSDVKVHVAGVSRG